MSDLLEQAIIDAAALKEAAIKNAENALIEKYSHEFKSTVEKLLEQEQLAAPVADPAAPPPPAGAAPTDPAAAQLPTDPNAAPTDPTMQATPAAGEQDGEDDPLNVIPAAFADADDDELVTIDFKGIKEALNRMMGVQEEVMEEAHGRRGDEEGGADAIYKTKPHLAGGHQIEEMDLQEDENAGSDGGGEGGGEGAPSMEEELELEGFELEEEVIEEMETDTTAAVAGTSQDQEIVTDKDLLAKQAEKEQKQNELKAKLDDAMAKREAALKTLEGAKSAEEAAKTALGTTSELEEEQMQISEEELMELAEELRIDLNIDAQGRGYMGSTSTEKRLQRDVELAKARSDDSTKAREDEMEKMGDLIQENADLSSKVKELTAFNQEMVTVLQSLKEHVEQMNISNAKLLYTNKALVNISLNERQKNQIVESISKAGSVLEAKTVYETLQSAVESVEKQDKAPKSLSEALNRAQTPFVVRKTPANSINDMQTQRMKLLAGIKSTK